MKVNGFLEFFLKFAIAFRIRVAWVSRFSVVVADAFGGGGETCPSTALSCMNFFHFFGSLVFPWLAMKNDVHSTNMYV